MTITFAQLVVWIVVGAAAGSLAGSVVTGKWEGLGRWTSLGIGLVGALIGGAIFRLLVFGRASMHLRFRFEMWWPLLADLSFSWLCFGSSGATEGPARRAARA